jgi:hypothetical protein
MSIRDNVMKVKKQILAEVDEDNQPFTDGVQQKAIAAILKGIGSTEWEAYMRLFVDAERPEQLARLMAADDTKDDKAMNRARAYLVADAPCGTDTVINFGRAASELLDVGLDNEPAPQ